MNTEYRARRAEVPPEQRDRIERLRQEIDERAQEIINILNHTIKKTPAGVARVVLGYAIPDAGTQASVVPPHALDPNNFEYYTFDENGQIDGAVCYKDPPGICCPTTCDNC